jgi:hypothetical protein
MSAALVCALLSFPARADKLRITTVPSGATVQINGVLVGTTPYQQNIPGGYLHKTKTSFKSAHHADWSRSISILKDSTVTVKAAIDPI